jgi:hypothetical protein
LKKLILGLVAVLALGGATVASADPVIGVADPTGDQFTGTYVISEDDPSTPDVNEYEEGTQEGYVGVHGTADDPANGGIVVCNGNPELTRPDDGSPLVGYIWIGPGMAASNVTAASPGNVVGAGSNHEDADGNPTGESPCPDADADDGQ